MAHTGNAFLGRQPVDRGCAPAHDACLLERRLSTPTRAELDGRSACLPGHRPLQLHGFAVAVGRQLVPGASPRDIDHLGERGAPRRCECIHQVRGAGWPSCGADDLVALFHGPRFPAAGVDGRPPVHPLPTCSQAGSRGTGMIAPRASSSRLRRHALYPMLVLYALVGLMFVLIDYLVSDGMTERKTHRDFPYLIWTYQLISTTTLV